MKKIITYTGFLVLIWPSLLFSQATGDYRSLLSGAWTTATNWEMYNGTAWVTAATAPNGTNGVITVRSPHTMNITTALTLDQVVIDAGGAINWTAGILTIANSAVAGPDLIINGTMFDASTSNINFAAGATWQISAGASLVRSKGNSAANWQNNYETGIANIPAGSNWIIRKNSTTNPSLTTIGAYYGNLIIENTLGTAWNTTATAGSFTGSTGFPTIKGNLDIGGSGTGTISFLNSLTFATPVTVLGNVIVRSVGTLRNYGTGFRIGGDLTVLGTLGFDGDHGRLLEFNGSSTQTISVSGNLNIHQLIVNKPSGTLNLNNTITINNNLTLTSGLINTTATAYVLLTEQASVTGGSNTSFINGPVMKQGQAAFIFPVGKNSDIQPIGMGVASPGGVLFTEDFNTGAPTWNKNVVTGTEGADFNYFDFDDDEGGVGSWACGVANNGNLTMHITSQFFPGGGAAYDAGGACGLLTCPRTSRRSESPVIDCSGKTDIMVSFSYIEGGSGTLDNATLWYFDGTTWAQVNDMPKTLTCTSGQGVWNRYYFVLPSSANNNPNVRIAFQWVNNDDGAGTDPSFAVDDLVVAEAIAFTAEYFYSNPQTPYGNTLAPPLTTLSSCEYWTLDRSLGLSSRSVTLEWDANSCTVPSLSTLRVARYDGAGTWQDEGNTGTTGTTAAGTVTSNPVSSFSPFTLADITVLPIQLLDFQANHDGTNVNCTWMTASELNNDFFTIERTTDGKHYVEIGYVKGSGTTNIQHDYAFPDRQPVKGQSYYRLKQTDYNGQYTYSQLRPVNIGQGTSLQIDFIAQGSGQVDFNYTLSNDNHARLMVHDMTGKCVYSSAVSGNKISLDKSLWSKGLYTVMITDGRNADQRKFIIE